MAKQQPYVSCTIKELPTDEILAAAQTAVSQRPSNLPNVFGLQRLFGINEAIHAVSTLPLRIAAMTSKRWANGTKITVGFMDGGSAELQRKILQYMNAWSGEHGGPCNIEFVPSDVDQMVRIARQPGQGHYSFLGTDCLHAPRNQQTMNFDSFTINTPDSEYARVVKHEAAHSLACPHEHSRLEIVQRLHRAKTIAYFMRTQGWSEQDVLNQILTPLNEMSIRGTPNAMEDSIMAYSFPGAITIDGKPIVGGKDITKEDSDFMASFYPMPGGPQPETPPVVSVAGITFAIDADTITVTAPAKYKTIRKTS